MIKFRSIYFFVLIVLFSRTFFSQTEQGFFLDDWTNREINVPAAYIDTVKPTGDVAVTVTFNAKDTLTKVSPYLFGHNVNTFFGVYYNNSRLIRDIRNLGAAVFRYPGGSGSNIFFWDRSSHDGIPSDANITNAKFGVSDDPNYLSLDNFYKLRDSANVTGVFVVNYSYARYGTSADPVAKAAHYAADWVRYDNGRTKFWEVGNENYGSWEEGYEIDTTLNQDGQPRIINGTLYGQHFKVFADSMRAAANEIGATIYIGAVGYKRSGSWNDEVTAQVGNVADYMIVHQYFGRRRDDGRDYILNTAFGANAAKDAVTDALINNGFSPLPVAMTEWNINEYGSKQKVSFVNGMHAVLTLGQMIRNGYGFATRWNLVWRYKGGNTHGLIAANRDNDDEGISAYMPRAPFFYFYFFKKYFGDVMLASNVTGSDSVTAYASSFSNGPVGVIVINRSGTAKVVKIDDENYDAGERYYWYVLTGGSDNGEFSRKTYVNGHGTSEDAGGPANYYELQPYSAQVQDSVTISLPAYSVAYLLLDGSTPVSVELTSLTATTHNNSVILTWHTATEVNNFGFEVQRSAKGEQPSEWETIGFVEGAGNSNSPKVYSFIDKTPPSGTIKYRLKQIDLDGAFEYSQIVIANVDAPEEFVLLQNFPNPFNPATTISYSIPALSVIAGSSAISGTQSTVNVTLTVYNALGEKIATLVNKMQSPGNYTVQFDARELPSGVYFYTLRVGDFISTKKMLLLK